jgi:putative membrane protein
MKRLLMLVFFLLLVVLGASFALHNPAQVTLNYYFGSLSAPLSLLLMSALALGSLLGILVSLLLVFSQRRTISRLQRKLNVCEQEVQNLRHVPLRDNG